MLLLYEPCYSGGQDCMLWIWLTANCRTASLLAYLPLVFPDPGPAKICNTLASEVAAFLCAGFMASKTFCSMTLVRRMKKQRVPYGPYSGFHEAPEKLANHLRLSNLSAINWNFLFLTKIGSDCLCWSPFCYSCCYELQSFLWLISGKPQSWTKASISES